MRESVQSHVRALVFKWPLPSVLKSGIAVGGGRFGQAAGRITGNSFDTFSFDGVAL